MTPQEGAAWVRGLHGQEAYDSTHPLEMLPQLLQRGLLLAGLCRCSLFGQLRMEGLSVDVAIGVIQAAPFLCCSSC